MTIREFDSTSTTLEGIPDQRQQLIQLLARMAAKYWYRKIMTQTPVLPLYTLMGSATKNWEGSAASANFPVKPTQGGVVPCRRITTSPRSD